jgi:hypothetical protein
VPHCGFNASLGEDCKLTENHRIEVTVATNPNSMTIATIPNFTDPAAKLWASIPPVTKKLLLSNVYCGKCRRDVTMTSFTGAVKDDALLLVGLCSECRGDIARVIEANDCLSCSFPQA